MCVVWEDDMALVAPAVVLRNCESVAVCRVLGLHGKYYSQEKAWRVSRDNWRRIAQTTRGGDPETYISWGKPRPPEHKPMEGRLDRNEFVEWLHNAGVGKSVEEVSYFYKEICHGIADYLINKEKPVDMYFIKLHNCPFRANWKYLLLQRYRKLGIALHRKSGVEFDWVLHKSGFMEEFLSLDLIAFCKQQQTCFRTVEVEHLKPWWKIVRKAEGARKTLKGPYQYAQYFSDSIKRFIPSAVRLYMSFLAQVAKPCVAPVEGGHDGRFRYLQAKQGRLLPSLKKYCALPAVISKRLPAYQGADDIDSDVFAANGGVPEVLPVQPTAQDVRDDARPQYGVDVDQSRNGKE